jgi:hypothetical protein
MCKKRKGGTRGMLQTEVTNKSEFINITEYLYRIQYIHMKKYLFVNTVAVKPTKAVHQVSS